MKNFTIIGLMLLMLCGCSQQPSYQTTTLPSGRQVKVLKLMTMHFSNDSPALLLEYQTDIPIDKKTDLTAEVDDIWMSFREDVEKAKLDRGIIKASEKPTGFIIKKHKSFGFVFTKGADGSWIRK